MKRRFLLVIISVILAFTTAFSVVACKGAKDDDPILTPSTESGSTDTGSSTGGGDDPIPTPPPVVDPNMPEERDDYTVSAIADNVYGLYIKDIIAQGSTAITGALDGMLFGDVYSAVIGKALESSSDLMPGMNLNAFDVNVYRGVDGNWYKETSKTAVNGCLNEILNYKLDGTGELNINYALYGEKTLAYVFFEYSENAPSSDLKNGVLKALFAQSPLINGFAQTTVNEVKTLVEGTNAQREAILVKNFGAVTIGTFLNSLVSADQKNNKFVQVTLGITVKDVYDMKNASTTAEVYTKLSDIYKGVYLSEVFGVNEGDVGYIREIYTMTLGGIFNAAANGTVSDYVLDNVGNLTLDKIVKAYIPATNAEALAAYAKFYEANKTALDLSLNQVLTALQKGDATADAIRDLYANVKDQVIYGTITVDEIVHLVISNLTFGDTGVTGFKYQNFAKTLYDLLKAQNENQDGVQPHPAIVAYFEMLWIRAKGELEQFGFSAESVKGYLTDNCQAVVTAVLEAFSGKTGDELNAYLKEFASTNLQSVIEEVEALVKQESFELENAINDFIANNAELLVKLALNNENFDKAMIQAIIDKNTILNDDGSSVVLYDEVLNEIVKAYGMQLVGAMTEEICNYLDYLKLEEDYAVYSFVSATDGTVFDVTVNEVLTLIQESLKLSAGLENDAQGALITLVGNAKVSTIIEMLQSLNQPETNPDENVIIK